MPPRTFEGAPALFANADKLVHFFMFFVLAIAVYLDYQQNKYASEHVAKILFCWCFPVLFGLAIEGVQHFFLPLRTGDLRDWFFDCLGYIHGFVSTKIFFKIKNKNGTKG
jgi:VanZ family protein